MTIDDPNCMHRDPGVGGAGDADGASIPVSRPLGVSSIPAERILAPLGRRESLVELLFLFFILFFPSVMRYFLVGTGAADLAGELGSNLYFWVVATGAVALALVAFILHKDGHRWRSVGFCYRSILGEVFAAGCALGVIYLLQVIIFAVIYLFWPEILEKAFKKRIELVDMFDPTQVHLAVVVAFCLFVGFYEELVFRGFVLTRLRMLSGSWSLAVVVGSVVFALPHGYEGHLAVLQIFSVSLVLSGLFVLRGNIVSPMLAHAAFNFISLTAAYFIKASGLHEKLQELSDKLLPPGVWLAVIRHLAG